MKRFLPTILAVAGITLTCTFSPLASPTPTPQALILPLQCAQGDCPLLHGSPQTAGMRSGFVRLMPGETVGWHTTGNNEESLVILRGRGEARLEGQPPRPLAAPAFAYIPPSTRHNLANTGEGPLEYVYVVAPRTQINE
jgi:mannose-6-phosphate isomerase-like protein (cupin superfamily)